MVLHAEQDPGDGVLPLFRCVSQAGTVDMDVEAAGAGLGAFWMWSFPSWKKAMPVASVPRTSAAFPSSRMICRRWEGASFPL